MGAAIYLYVHKWRVLNANSWATSIVLITYHDARLYSSFSERRCITVYGFLIIQVNRKIATVQFTGFDQFTSTIVRIVACHGNNHHPMNPLT